MRYAFTSTRMLSPSDIPCVDHWLREHFEDGDEFTTGGCWGGDFHIGKTLFEWFPDRLHRVVIPGLRQQVESWWSAYTQFIGDHIILEEMPEGSDYRSRNERVVDHGDVLGAVAEYPEDDGRSRRSGTWMTVRIAQRRSVPVVTMTLRKSGESR